MSDVRYIVGARASADRPSRLVASSVAPIVSGLEGRVCFPRTKDGKPAGTIENLYFRTKRGRVEEWRSPYTGQRIVGRETDDPAIISEIDAAEARVEEARRALSEALRHEQEVLDAAIARSKPAKVTL